MTLASQTSPADVFRIAGATLTIECADRRLRALIRDAWAAFRIDAASGPVHAVFRFPDRSAGALPRLKTWHTFVSPHVVVRSDGRRYLLTGYMYDHPWQFDCRSMPNWDPDFIYYYVCEPLMHDVLKALGVLVWHSAAVEYRGRALLLPAVSGSGKSTTVLNLLSVGCRFVADDVVVVREGKSGPTVTGFESGLYLTRTSIGLLPEWRAHVSGGRVKKGQQWKHRVELTSFRSTRTRAPRVAGLVFPRVGKGRLTRLEAMSEAQALISCLGQKPKEFPGSSLGAAALARQFELYDHLVRTAKSYRLTLGSDQTHVRTMLTRLCAEL